MKNYPLIISGAISLVLIGLLFFQNQSLKRQVQNQTSAITQTPTPTPTALPSNWQTFTNDLFHFQFAYPPLWHQIKDSSKFQNFFVFEATDKSQLQIIIDTTTKNTLTDYLDALDRTNQTSWEGKPSKKVLSLSNVKVGSFNAIERKEEWLAAGFTTLATYTKVDDKIFIFNILPGDKSFDHNDIYSSYPAILSSFKSLEN